MSHDKEFYVTTFAIVGGLAAFAIILVIVATNLTSEVSDYQPEEIIIENIKPVGNVYIAGESEPEAVPTEKVAADEAATAEPKSGEQVYNSACVSCHGTGVAGAPKLGDTAAWAPRIAAGMESLLANATNGLNAMPPKGSCMACSDEELSAAVDYVVSNSQ